MNQEIPEITIQDFTLPHAKVLSRTFDKNELWLKFGFI